MSIAQTVSIGGDIEVCRMGFGAMRITGKGSWGWPKDQDRASKVCRRAMSLGINFIDTADAYGPETSEYLLDRFLHPYEGICIATKGGLQRGGPRNWSPNGRPQYLKLACENSLRRLRVDRIDLYQLHAIDPEVPLEESLGALKDMQNAGKIRHIGVSNFEVDEIERAQSVATIASVQNRYNLLDRSHEAVVSYCEKNKLVFIPWYPLATGDLTRDTRWQEIAAAHKATAGQIALSWLLHKSPTILPIPGTCSVKHLEQNYRAMDINLSDSEMNTLHAITQGLP